MLWAIAHCPMTSGRSIDAVLRLVIALQTSNANKGATPEGGQPGDKMIVPPLATAAAAGARSNEDYACADGSVCRKALCARV